MTTFNAKPNVLPNLMWIMDRIFKFTNFGIVSILHQDFFIVSVSTKFFLRLHIYGYICIHESIEYRFTIIICFYNIT